MNDKVLNVDMPDVMPREPGEAILALGQPVEEAELDRQLSLIEGIVAVEEEAGSPHGALAVALARAEYRTVGGAKYERYFGYGSVNWCALFVSWAVDMTGNKDGRAPWENPAWVPSIHAWAQAHHRLFNRPLHGDIFGLGGEHTGLVVGATPDGSAIYTIEGNITNSVTARSLSSSGLWFARLPD